MLLIRMRNISKRMQYVKKWYWGSDPMKFEYHSVIFGKTKISQRKQMYSKYYAYSCTIYKVPDTIKFL